MKYIKYIFENIFSETCFLFSVEIVGIVGPNGPPPTPPHTHTHTTPIPGVNVKVPFWGKKWKQMFLLLIFYGFYVKKLKTTTKMIRLTVS